MNYNDFYMEPAAWVGKVTKEEAESLKGRNTLLYSGIFICHDWRHKDKVVDPENSGLLPSEIAEAVESSMEAGANGISIFTIPLWIELWVMPYVFRKALWRLREW